MSIPKLLSLNEWREQRFTGRKPALSTCKRWCSEGHVPAKKIGKLWYVCVQDEIKLTGNDLVDSVINGS